MTEAEVKKELTLLRTIYPEYFRTMTSEEGKKLLKAWTELLRPDKPEQFHAALLDTIRQSKWMPKLQEIFQNYPQDTFTAQDWEESKRNCLAILGRKA